MKLIFEWDEEKAKENFRKHKVSFEEAKTVFGDPFLMTFPDPEHSDSEQRYFNIGISSKGQVLITVHTERKRNIRIINCRKANTNERRAYEEGNI
ncbi:BrnT family toxin [bacterium]|nr:BrnT family toxin [bacterium]MBU1752626.1 BrnT family toxin [bacterium]